MFNVYSILQAERCLPYLLFWECAFVCVSGVSDYVDVEFIAQIELNIRTHIYFWIYWR